MSEKRESARGDWDKGVGKKKRVGATKSGSKEPLEKKTRSGGLPKASGGWPESPKGKPRPSSFRDPNPGMRGVKEGTGHAPRRAMRKAAVAKMHHGGKRG